MAALDGDAECTNNGCILFAHVLKYFDFAQLFITWTIGKRAPNAFTQSTSFNIYYCTHIIIINTELHHSHSQKHAISIHSICFYVILNALHKF